MLSSTNISVVNATIMRGSNSNSNGDMNQRSSAAEKRGRSSSSYGHHQQQLHQYRIKRPSSEDPSRGTKTNTINSKSGGGQQGVTETTNTMSVSNNQEQHGSTSSNSQKQQQLLPRQSSTTTERRGSAASATSSNSNGFRRLKKFSPGKKSSSTKRATPIVNTATTASSTQSSSSSPPSSSCAKTEPLSVSEQFQQTQLRLWKAAQERHQKIQLAQEQKRLRKLKRKKQQQREKEELAADQGDGDDNDDNRSSSSSSGNTEDAREAFRKKTMKQRKKQQMFEEEERLKKETESVALASTTASSSSPTEKKKKKRRLVKMGSSSNGDAGDGPSKKKIKTSTNKVINAIRKKKSAASSTTTMAAVSSTTTELPTTPTLNLALADTVKTRVRSCNKKDRDELEILQAVSFETKKRKKQRKRDRLLALKAAEQADCDSGVVESNGLKKKKKKKRVPRTIEENDAAADDEAPLDNPVVKRKRGRPPKKHKKPTVEDAAPLEASLSSTTVVTGAIKKKKKKKVKREGGDDPCSKQYFLDETVSSFDAGSCKQDHPPLPLKKRMALAAAAEASTSWEKTATMSTAPSKVSISSAGSGPGATPEFGNTEASSISEFTHPLGAMPPPAAYNAFAKSSTSVPREILSNTALAPSQLPSFDMSTSLNNSSSAVIGPGISSDESDSDSSSDSDTDDEELFSFANQMFGTSAKPAPKGQKVEASAPETSNLTTELCDMEKRRQRQEEARTLTAKEVNAILREDSGATDAQSWVRRSVRLPSRSLLNAPLTKTLLDKLRGNDSEMVVLKMKKFISDPDTPAMVIEATLDALEDCTNCESLYIQNFNQGMRDKQVLHLLKILQLPTCNIWCLNIGETYNVTEDTWETFAEGLKTTKITHMYASEHTITSELKDEIRETIRLNRRKHSMHNDPNNLDVIIQCTHCWWNPINSKKLQPFLRKRGFESLLQDKEAQGLRGSMSEAPAK